MRADFCMKFYTTVKQNVYFNTNDPERLLVFVQVDWRFYTLSTIPKMKSSTRSKDK